MDKSSKDTRNVNTQINKGRMSKRRHSFPKTSTSSNTNINQCQILRDEDEADNQINQENKTLGKPNATKKKMSKVGNKHDIDKVSLKDIDEVLSEIGEISMETLKESANLAEEDNILLRK